MSKDLQTITGSLDDLIARVRPLADILPGLEQARDALDPPTAKPKPKRKPKAKAKPRSSNVTALAPRRAARGERERQLIDAVRAEPGLTVAELAGKLGVPAPGLYRPVRRLGGQRVLRKRGTRVYPGREAEKVA